MTTVAIIGTGYVGLTTGACLAKLGHKVICADIDSEKIMDLKNGIIPIYEEGLSDLVQTGLANGNLDFIDDSTVAVASSEFVFMCLPTPQDKNGSADLSYLKKATESIKSHIIRNGIVINKSTVPVGTSEMVAGIINRDDVAVVSNPEFLREGSAVSDFMSPDRVIIGSYSPSAAEKVASLYSSINPKFVITDPVSAEMIKYTSNAYLACRLSFVNSVANLSEELGANTEDVVRGMTLDSRIGNSFFKPGPGWGGSCFPKDTLALKEISLRAGYDFSMLDEIMRVNQLQFERVKKKIIESIGSSAGKVAVFGLTFKAGTDDLRASPSVEIIKMLVSEGIQVTAYDPTVTQTRFNQHYPELKIRIVNEPYLAVEDAQICVILTEWPQFTELDMDRISDLMQGKTVIDTRGVIDKDKVVDAGLIFEN